MRISKHVLVTSILTAVLSPLTVLAADDIKFIQHKLDVLQQQLQELQKQQSESASQEDVDKLKQEVKGAAEWKETSTLIHMAGYADVGYTNGESDDGSFNLGSFSPIFHFQYRDLVMLESELEIEVDAEGESEFTLEYLTADFIVNDNIVVVGGKFLSPLGQFRQNLHPSWINKLPSAPPGFGHDGAAPISEMGLQMRGGLSLNGMSANYAVYIGNGPEINAVSEDDEIELEGIEAEAFGKDRDGEKVVGGRFGILPWPKLEIGVSAITGKGSVTALVDEETGSRNEVADDPARDYDVLGLDFAWRYSDLETRGEFVRSKIGDSEASVAEEGATWQTWYIQGAYRFIPDKWEGVIRYTDFDSPHASEDLAQWALGVNHLFANNLIGKIAYEFNDNDLDSSAGDDRLLLQFAYGF